MNSTRSVLEGPEGYSTGLRFTARELERLREIIRDQWLHRIKEVAPHAAERFAAIPMEHYHELAGLIDHRGVWPKQRRILGPEAAAEIRTMSVLRELQKEYGNFLISNEEDIGREELYWRLVRPDSPADVGPIHADAWFWELGHGITPPGSHRVKVWIAIFCENGRSGFRFVPGSHKKNWPYHGGFRDGFVKPQIDLDESELDTMIFESDPGDVIIFNDRLLHGGAVGGTRTRVSLECTLFVEAERYFSTTVA